MRSSKAPQAQAAEPTPPSSAAKKKRGRPLKSATMTTETQAPKPPGKKRGKKSHPAEQGESDVKPPAMTAEEGPSTTSAEGPVKQADSNDDLDMHLFGNS